MENLNAPHYMHPNFRLLLLALVSALLMLSIWLVSYTATVDKTLLASTVALSEPRNHQPLPLAAKVQISSLEAVLEELLKRSTAEHKQTGVYSEIPSGTQLLGYSVQNNVVTVNLSKEFKQGAGATSAIERVEELKKAVRRVNPNYKLTIAVEGKPLTILTSDGLELDKEM